MSDSNHRSVVERRKLENEIFVFDGEKRSYEGKREAALLAMARIRKDIAELESQLEDLHTQKTSYDHRIYDAEEEIARIKRKMNLL